MEKMQHEEGEPDPIEAENLVQWMRSEYMHGIILTENEIVRGYAIILTSQVQCIVRALRVDKEHRRHGYGTKILKHILRGLIAWNKTYIQIDISEKNTGARKFLMKEDKSGFVIVIMSEFTDPEGDYIEAFYEMQYPPPPGFNPKRDLRFFVNGEEKPKRS